MRSTTRRRRAIRGALAGALLLAAAGGCEDSSTDAVQNPGPYASMLAGATTERSAVRWTSPDWPSTPVTGLALWREGNALRGHLSFSGLRFQGEGGIDGAVITMSFTTPNNPGGQAYRFEGTLASLEEMRGRLTRTGAAGDGFTFRLVRDP